MTLRQSVRNVLVIFLISGSMRVVRGRNQDHLLTFNRARFRISENDRGTQGSRKGKNPGVTLCNAGVTLGRGVIIPIGFKQVSPITFDSGCVSSNISNSINLYTPQLDYI